MCIESDIGDHPCRIASSRCNVSSATDVFLTRAFMTADNKSNAGRKENRDVVPHRTRCGLYCGAARLVMAIASAFLGLLRSVCATHKFVTQVISP